MTAPRDPFSAALSAIRVRMRSGELVQGEQLIVSELAGQLRLSATPVREALARLAGEGVIEDRRGAGYFAWRPDAVDLAELYDLQVDYLRGAILRARSGRGPIGAEPSEATAAPDDPLREALLLRLVQWSRSPVLQRAHLLLADRLAPARRIETAVLKDIDVEWATFDEALRREEGEALSAWTDEYARRRRAAAAELVAAMRSAAAG